MYRHTFNILIGFLTAAIGFLLYKANQICCPTGALIMLLLSGVGFGVFCASIILFDREEARKERLEELGEKNEN